MSVTDAVLGRRYRLESRLAAGGIGEVWRGVDLVLHRRVAVKLLRREYADHPETLARFRAEARHAGSLSHPGIAQVYDYGEADPPHPAFLVMELVDGPSLAGVLAAGPLDAARTMDVVAQAAAALDTAHGAGLVHRDIKPGNLLLGPGGTVKVTDFGIAHAAGSAPLTRTGTLVGTPAYLAPERAAGGPAVPASDLYSLGVVAYECLAGAAPFTGSPLEVAVAHQHRPLPPLPAAVPGDVAALVAELTAKDPAARPASAAQVARRAGLLRDAMTANATIRLPGGHDVPPPPPTGALPETLAGPPLPVAPGRQLHWQRAAARPRRRLALAGAALLAAGLAGWGLASLTQPAQPHQGTAWRPAAPASSAIPMVQVNGAQLAGQPVAKVSRQLRQLGLQPRVVREPGGEQEPGTVISVHPSGQVPVGSVITITATAQAPGHGKAKHNHGG